MKKAFFLTLTCLTLLFAFIGCYRVQPNPGEESVLVYKPFIFGHGGVDPKPVSTGAEWCAITTEHKEFPITPITIMEEFTNMIPSDNTPVSFSAYLKCQIRKGETPKLYQEFGAEWYEHNLQASFRTMVRDMERLLFCRTQVCDQLLQQVFREW